MICGLARRIEDLNDEMCTIDGAGGWVVAVVDGSEPAIVERGSLGLLGDSGGQQWCC